MTEEKKMNGEATQEQIQAWKATHKEVFQIVVGESVCYLHKPDRNTMKAIASIGSTDPIRANEVLLANCWLGGDESIKEEDEKFFGVSTQLANLVEIKEAELKKL